MINNFDTNSKGTDIELNIFYDQNQSQDDFDENFKLYGEYRNRGINTYVYTGYDEKLNEPEWHFKSNDIKEILLKLFEFSEFSDYRDFKNEYFDGYSWRDLFHGDLEEIFQELLDIEFYEHEQLEELTEIDFIEINYKIISVTGYSQGDYAHVIIMNDIIKQQNGDISSINKMCNNYFYDCPIWGEININGQEYFVYEYLEDNYFWDKDFFIENFIKIHPELKHIKDELEEMIPEDLSYE